jgi:Tol biopolymer transport system component
MTGKRWERVKEITADALEREPSERTEFVSQASRGDAEIAREVLRLLAEADHTDTEFLSTLPINAKDVLQEFSAPLPCFTPGQNVAGRFRIIRFLNRGGMGEVYSAFDQELQEVVALKTIRPAIASIEAVTNRFKTEVRQTRHVTHANVCRVYDLFNHAEEDSDPVWFLTMEFLEGPTLADRLHTSGAMPMDRALPLIRDMVAALSTAHDLGIVHRDFKPSNIMLVKNESGGERAMVTDFGLALSLTLDKTAKPLDQTEGTPAYMAPEQALGQPVTTATDQFSLGLVIAELLTGKPIRPDRRDPQKLRAEVDGWLRAQPRDRLSANAVEVIRRCLQFRPADRFRDVREIVPILDGTRDRRRQQRIIGGVAAAAAVAAIAFVISRQDWGERVTELSRVTAETDLGGDPILSADGNWLVYLSDRLGAGDLDVWMQRTGSTAAARKLNHRPANDDILGISPDGKSVAFTSGGDSPGLYLVGADGSGERLLVPGAVNSPVFSPNGQSIAYWVGEHDSVAAVGRIFVVPAGGGDPRRLAETFAAARYPIWSPDGKYVLFEGCRTSGPSLSDCLEWWTVLPEGGEPRSTGAIALLRASQIELRTPPSKNWFHDKLVFDGRRHSEGRLWELTISPNTLEVTGKPRTITSGLTDDRAPSVSPAGEIVFGHTSSALHIWRVAPKPGDRDLAPVRLTDDPGLDCCPSVSHDGRWLFFTRKLPDSRHLFLKNLESGSESELSTPPGDKTSSVANADGTRVVFESRDGQGSTSIGLWSKDQGARMLCSKCAHPASWFGDTAVFYITSGGQIALLDVSNGASHVVVEPREGAALDAADWNPATEYLMFTSIDGQGDRQAFAVRFPRATAQPGPEWITLVSASSAPFHPRWSGDGKKLIYLSKRDGHLCLWEQAFDPTSGVAGTPVALQHYHTKRFSPENIMASVRGLSVAGNSVFLNIAELSQSIWSGTLKSPGPFELLRKLF